MLKKLTQWIFGLYVFYLAVSLLIVMPALNIMAPRIVQETLDRDLNAELLIFNPFTLSVEARGASITEKSAHRPLALKTLRVNLSLATLIEPGVVLDEFLIEDLDVHVLRYEGGEFHFDDLLADTDQPAADSDEPIPYLTIHEVAIDAHTLRFTDRTRPGPYTTVQRDFQLNTRNVTTVPSRQGDGLLELTSDGGGRLRWTGDMDIAAGLSQGTFTLDNIDLTHLWRYNAEDLAFVVRGARFGAQLNYALDWSADTQLLLSDSAIRLNDIDLVPASSEELPDTALSLREVNVTGIALDFLEEALSIDAVAISGLHISGYDEDGQASIVRMLAGEQTMDESAAADEPAVEEEEESADWKLTLSELTIRENQVQWKTDYLSPEVIEVSPLEASMSDFAWPATAAAPLSLMLRINDQVGLDIAGALNPSSGIGALDVTLDRWQLEWLNPLVNEQARTDIRRGTFSLKSNVQLEDFSPTTLSGELQIQDFATELHETGERAFTLDALLVDRFDTSIEEQLTRVNLLTLERPAGSLHIREDGRMNINGVIRETPGTASADEQNDPTSEGEEAPWGLVLSQLSLHDGRLDFADSSLPLPFKTVVEGIEAEIRDIDSTSPNPLSLEFRGSVDGYAPVVISGRGTPFDDAPGGQVNFNFRGIDIATMSPYAGTYAGYTIESGSLTLDLKYALAGEAIDGENRIVISQMQLGEPVDSELAIDVPLKLGIALLTDSNGIIDLDVPVSGSVDDPEFSLGRVIGRAIGNVIVKAVTAPFSLLAGLVGSDEDLENVPFPIGSEQADEAGLAALASLAEALGARPQLQLQIGGGFDPIEDRSFLRERALEASFLEAGLDPESLRDRDEKFAEMLSARMSELLPETADTESDEEPPSLDDQWQRLLARQEISPSALQDLATQRAAAAKRSLVIDHAVDAARIAISFDDTLSSAGVRMSLDS